MLFAILKIHFNLYIFFWEAVDFLDKLLRYDHQERPTAKEAMVSQWSLPVKTLNLYKTVDIPLVHILPIILLFWLFIQYFVVIKPPFCFAGPSLFLPDKKCRKQQKSFIAYSISDAVKINIFTVHSDLATLSGRSFNSGGFLVFSCYKLLDTSSSSSIFLHFKLFFRLLETYLIFVGNLICVLQLCESSYWSDFYER